jgi:mannose-6-phosphate isomerase-like protein (cupin superfamily)
VLIKRNDLPHTDRAHELVGATYDVPVSLILVHVPPGDGPALHRHPYPEVFVIEHGQATIRVGADQVVAQPGQIAIAPANSLHGFVNSGPGELRLTAIHTAPRFTTDWATGPDADWTSPPDAAPPSPPQRQA